MDYEFPTKVNGYHYLKESLIMVLEDNSLPSNKMLFSTLADKFNTDEANIDRCLRTIVDKMWQSLAKVGLFIERPTNREFIYKCAEFVGRRDVQASVYDILLRPD